MKNLVNRRFWSGILAGLLTSVAQAGTLEDDFSASHDYLADGLAGTVWEGIMFGDLRPADVVTWDANLSAANAMRIIGTGGGWEGGTDGPFLWRMISGDFTATVFVSGYVNSAYNDVGIMARNPDTSSGQNYVFTSVFEHPEWGLDTITRSILNDAQTDYNVLASDILGAHPRWLRLERMGAGFIASASLDGSSWNELAFVDRPDLPDSLQVGLFQCTYSDIQAYGEFQHYRLEGDNVSVGTEPAAASGLTIVDGVSGALELSWTPGSASTGSLVLLRANGPLTRQPTDGIAYAADAAFGAGSDLGAGNYVVYAGSGSSVSVSGLQGNVPYFAAVYAYNASGVSPNFALTSPPTGSRRAPAQLESIALELETELVIGTQYAARVMATYDVGVSDVTADSTFVSSDPSVASVDADGRVAAQSFGSATITASFAGRDASQTVTVRDFPAAVMTHRYSFDEDASDSVGDAHGELIDNAVTWGDGYVTLSSLNPGYVNLPNDMFTSYESITVETWAIDQGSAGWARLWDFGNSYGGEDISDGGSRYMFLSLPSGNGNLRGAYTITGGGAGEQILEWVGRRPPANTPAHIVWTTYGPARTGWLYVDGVLVGQNNNITLTPASIGPMANIWIGRSQFADPYFNGLIDEVRIYNSPMSALQVAINAAAGPSNIVANPGTISAVRLTLPSATMLRDAFQDAAVYGDFTGIANVPLTTLPGIQYTSADPSVVAVSSTGRVTAVGVGSTTVTATYQGASDTESVEVIVKPTVLQHRYSFDANANDLVGSAHGQLRGSATIAGGAVALNGLTDYVELPAGLLSGYDQVSFELWMTVDPGIVGNSDARLFALGSAHGANELGLVARSGGGNLWARLIAEGTEVGTIRGGNTATLGKVQVVVVCNPPQGRLDLYLDGRWENSNSTLSFPLSSVNNTLSYLGANLNLNAFVPCSIDEFRIYEGALDLAQVQISYVAGPSHPSMDLGTPTSVALGVDPVMTIGMRQLPHVRVASSTIGDVDLTGSTAAAFVSSDPDVVSVTTSGLLEAEASGKASITATVNGVSDTQDVYVIPKQLGLMHRYSFTADASDSVGAADGAVLGNAVVAGGEVILNGDLNSYVELPSHLFSSYDAVTFEFWASFGTNPEWARLYDFGIFDSLAAGDGMPYVFFTPHAGGGGMRSVLSDGVEVVLDVAGQNLDNLSDQHVVCVYDPPGNAMAVYVNGAKLGSASLAKPLSSVHDLKCWLGRSIYRWDPPLVASIDEFRVYHGALTDAQVQASFAAGVENPVIAPLSKAEFVEVSAELVGGDIVIAWPADATEYQLETSPVLGPNASWTTVPGEPVVEGHLQRITLPATESAAFYRLRK